VGRGGGGGHTEDASVLNDLRDEAVGKHGLFDTLLQLLLQVRCSVWMSYLTYA